MFLLSSFAQKNSWWNWHLQWWSMMFGGPGPSDCIQAHKCNQLLVTVWFDIDSITTYLLSSRCYFLQIGWQLAPVKLDHLGSLDLGTLLHCIIGRYLVLNLTYWPWVLSSLSYELGIGCIRRFVRLRRTRLTPSRCFNFDRSFQKCADDICSDLRAFAYALVTKLFNLLRVSISFTIIPIFITDFSNRMVTQKLISVTTVLVCRFVGAGRPKSVSSLSW